MLIVVAVNYVAISEALGLSPSVLAAGVAADNVICAVYFMVLFALASKIPAETAPPTDGTISTPSLLLIAFSVMLRILILRQDAHKRGCSCGEF